MTNKANIEQMVHALKRHVSIHANPMQLPIPGSVTEMKQVIEALQELQVLRATNAVIAGECGEQYNKGIDDAAKVVKRYAAEYCGTRVMSEAILELKK